MRATGSANRRGERRRIPQRCARTLLVACGAFSITTHAIAADPFGVDTAMPTAPAPGGSDHAVVARYWEVGRPRPFVAGTVDLGIAYLKPRIQAGYGRPFWSWAGVESYPVVGLSGVGNYSGAAVSIPGLTLRGGSRYFFPFSRALLEPKASYTRTDIELVDGPKADYMAFEGELTLTAPLFRGSVFGVLTGYRVAGVEQDRYLFEESLRVVMAPPYVWRSRLGYLLALGPEGAVLVGGAAEVIGLPGRNEFVVRAGIMASVAMTAQLEAHASIIPVIVSPDTIGLAGGDFGQLGVRFLWATGPAPDPRKLERPSEPER
jgi:hypothetical protein